MVGRRVSGGRTSKRGAVQAGGRASRGPGKRVFSLRSRVARNVPAVGVPPGLPCDIASAVPVFVDAGPTLFAQVVNFFSSPAAGI